MGWWQVNADTLAGGRFVISPLAEATACLKVLHQGSATHPGERGWLDLHLPAYRDRLARDPITALLVQAGLGGHWNADFLTPAQTGEAGLTFHQELARVREAPPETAQANLVVSLNGPLPAALHRSDLGDRAADLLEWVWTETVRPDWERRRRAFEADMVARTEQLSRGGWAAALDDMRPGMRWLGGGRLQINTRDYPPREISGARLLFVPVSPRKGWASWESSERYVVVYPCSGVLAAAGGAAVPEALGRLLGSSRAAVLVLLDTPMSTTQLVALTGQGLGSVGRHLKVLLDSRLIQRRRSGRSVLYYRTPAGEALVDAQTSGA